MPTPLRHQVHAGELLKLLDRIIPAMENPERFQSIRDWIADPDVTEAVYEERDRLFNLPVATAAGNLIPGDMVDLKSVSTFGSTKRTIKGATVGGNQRGVTEFDPANPADEVRLMRGGQSLRVKAREIVEITVVGRATKRVHGG